MGRLQLLVVAIGVISNAVLAEVYEDSTLFEGNTRR